MATRGGIKVESLHKSLVARLLPDLGEGVAANEAQAARIGTRPGVRAMNSLVVPASVVNGDTIVFGSSTFEVDIINTDLAVNTANTAAGALAGTGTHALVTLGAAPATAVAAGQVHRIENELLLVLRVLTTTTYVVARAYGGSAIAAHAQNLDVFGSDANPASNISVPLVTTLTPAAFAPAFVATFNFTPPTGEDRPARTSDLIDDYTALPTVGLDAGQQILVVANEAGVDVTATTEEFANSTDNVWANATLVGGVDPGVAASESSSRVVTASEDLQGEMHFFFPFTVRTAVVSVRTTAGVIKSFAGTILIAQVESTDATLPAGAVSIQNVGAASTAYAAPFAATDVVTVTAFE